MAQLCGVTEFGDVLVAPFDARALGYTNLFESPQRGVSAQAIGQHLHGSARVQTRGMRLMTVMLMMAPLEEGYCGCQRTSVAGALGCTSIKSGSASPAAAEASSSSAAVVKRKTQVKLENSEKPAGNSYVISDDETQSRRLQSKKWG